MFAFAELNLTGGKRAKKRNIYTKIVKCYQYSSFIPLKSYNQIDILFTTKQLEKQMLGHSRGVLYF